MVYIVHFVLSMMRHLNIYSNAMQDSEYLNSRRISHYSPFQWHRQRSSSAAESWDIFLVNTINIVRKLCEGENYNFQLNECCYKRVTVL